MMTGIELLVLAIHSLFVYHIITKYKFDFKTYLLTSSGMFIIYYLLKSTIIYTRARIKYLKSLSDISEIVKDKPIIKEAKKRNEELIAESEEKEVINNKENIELEEKKIKKKEEEKIEK